jgi:serpin B
VEIIFLPDNTDNYKFQINMTITNVLTWFFALIMMFSGCDKENDETVAEPKPIQLTEKSGKIIAAGNNFGVSLFREVSQSSSNNLMISPLSASAALTMLVNGANGATANQIIEMLGFESLTIVDINEAYQSLVPQLINADPEVQLAIANAVFYRENFTVEKSFLNTIESAFSANIEGLDFGKPSALKAINGWAKKNTMGKVSKVMDQISDDAVLFLMNALYFKGNWEHTFNKGKTMDAPFYLSNDSSITVKMMNSEIPVRLLRKNDFSAIELNYNRGNFSMIVILPSFGMENYLEKLNPSAWQSLITELDAITSTRKVVVSIPRFKFDFEKILNQQLKTLGMSDAFDQSKANLSGISGNDLFVSFVKQNTFIEVNEEGSEAAAATTVGVEIVSMPPAFTANKPFVFAIRERTTNTLLFIGKVEQPQD